MVKLSSSPSRGRTDLICTFTRFSFFVVLGTDDLTGQPYLLSNRDVWVSPPEHRATATTELKDLKMTAILKNFCYLEIKTADGKSEKLSV